MANPVILWFAEELFQISIFYKDFFHLPKEGVFQVEDAIP
jgi:hypothetical protein